MIHLQYADGWRGPYTEQSVVDAVASGTIPGDMIALTGDTYVYAADVVAKPSFWGTVFKVVAGAALVYVGCKVAAEVHDQLTLTREQLAIRDHAEALEARGHEVHADHLPGRWPRPALVGRRRPDVAVLNKRGDVVGVWEHETWESVSRTHSVEQDRDLRRDTRRMGIRYGLRIS